MPTKIEWADERWNPVAGCSKCSPGCLNCYAERMAHRLASMGNDNPQYLGKTDAKGKWMGKVECCPWILDRPLHWRKPRRIFVCSMCDLFHEKVPFEFIDRVCAVAALCPEHTFLMLTKRTERALEYYLSRYPMDNSYRVDRMPQWYHVVTDWLDQGEPGYLGKTWESCQRAAEKTDYLQPLPNLWLGVSVCIPEEKPKIDTLREIPAAVKFVSFEPLLRDMGELDLTGIDWVIVGGESGPGARPMHPDWARSIRDQCAAAGGAFFFKQWGKFVVPDQTMYHGHHKGWRFPVGCSYMKHDGTYCSGYPSGGISAWTKIYPVGKKKAGRLLDGQKHEEYPK